MSKTIRQYRSIPSHFPDANSMKVTATSQGIYGHGIQLTIGDEYIVMAENQVQDLIRILTKRMRCDKGYRSVESQNDYETIIPKRK